MCETLVTGITFERFVCLVTATVALEVGELGEGFSASDLSASIGFVAGVGADVLLKMRQLREFTLADLAAIRFDT